MKRIVILSTSLMLFVICLFSFSVNAFAFNNEYITNMGSWYKNGDLMNINNDVLSGQLRYILDENDACAYFYFIFSNCDGDYKDKDVSLEFEISNSANKYSFSVSKSGVKNGDKDIYINYDFDNVNSEFGNGRLLVGFEMKNKTDRSSLNQITCTFSAGSKNSCVILDDCVFDMRVSANNLSQNNSGSKSRSERRSTNSTSISAPKTNNKKASKSDATKFVMKHTINNHNNSGRQNKNDNNSTKFSGTGTTYDIKSSSSVLESNGDTTQNETVTSDFLNNNGGNNLSYPKNSKIAFKIAIFFAFLGIVALGCGLFLKDNNLSDKNNDNENQDDNE